jgi:hypothetical protein
VRWCTANSAKRRFVTIAAGFGIPSQFALEASADRTRESAHGMLSYDALAVRPDPAENTEGQLLSSQRHQR